METIRIELEQGFHALAYLQGDEYWACVYDPINRGVKQTAGWYRTANERELEARLRRVMATDRHVLPAGRAR